MQLTVLCNLHVGELNPATGVLKHHLSQRSSARNRQESERAAWNHPADALSLYFPLSKLEQHHGNKVVKPIIAVYCATKGSQIPIWNIKNIKLHFDIFIDPWML